MMSGGRKYECIAASTLPRLVCARLVPMPRYLRRAAATSPWVAIDPVLRADCVALCRNVRLALIAVFALIGLSRMACAAEPAANSVQTCEANLLAQNGNYDPAAAVERLFRRAPQRATSAAPLVRNVPAQFGFRLGAFRPAAAELDMERVHAPPATSLPLAFARTCIYFARSSLDSSFVRSSLAGSSGIFPSSHFIPPVRSLPFTIALHQVVLLESISGGCAVLRVFASAIALLSLAPTSLEGETAHVCC